MYVCTETPPAMSQVQGLVVLDTRTLLDREVVQIHHEVCVLIASKKH